VSGILKNEQEREGWCGEGGLRKAPWKLKWKRERDREEDKS